MVSTTIAFDVKAIVNKTKPRNSKETAASNDFGPKESADRRKDEAEAAAEPARKHRRAAEPKIDSGPIEATDRLRDVPRANWHDLMLARRQFLEIQLSSDCRHLVEFVNDAKLMFEALGFSSAKQMIREGYGLEVRRNQYRRQIAGAQGITCRSGAARARRR
jgi:hypothetical protein